MMHNKAVGTGICWIACTHCVHKTVSRGAGSNLLRIDGVASLGKLRVSPDKIKPRLFTIDLQRIIPPRYRGAVRKVANYEKYTRSATKKVFIIPSYSLFLPLHRVSFVLSLSSLHVLRINWSKRNFPLFFFGPFRANGSSDNCDIEVFFP